MVGSKLQMHFEKIYENKDDCKQSKHTSDSDHICAKIFTVIVRNTESWPTAVPFNNSIKNQ